MREEGERQTQRWQQRSGESGYGEPKKVGLEQGGAWLQGQWVRQRFENNLGYFVRSRLKNQTKNGTKCPRR